MTEEQIVEILKEKYGKVSAKIIAEECGIDQVYKVYRLAEKYGIRTNKVQNKTVGELSELQKQILIGGIFGDGSYKKQGNGYLYRECHALAESDYCNWKRLQLGKLTEGYVFSYSIRKSGLNEVLTFETMTTKDLEFYAKLNKNKLEAIDYMDKIGFCLFILDDGWRVDKTDYNKGNLVFMLTIYQYEEELRMKIIKRFKKLFGENSCTENGIKRIDLRIHNDVSMQIAEIILELLGSDMDIVQKKLFGNKQEKTYDDIKHLLISNKVADSHD